MGFLPRARSCRIVPDDYQGISSYLSREQTGGTPTMPQLSFSFTPVRIYGEVYGGGPAKGLTKSHRRVKGNRQEHTEYGKYQRSYSGVSFRVQSESFFGR